MQETGETGIVFDLYQVDESSYGDVPMVFKKGMRAIFGSWSITGSIGQSKKCFNSVREFVSTCVLVETPSGKTLVVFGMTGDELLKVVKSDPKGLHELRLIQDEKTRLIAAEIRLG